MLDVIALLPLVQPLGGEIKLAGVKFKLGVSSDELGFFGDD